MEIYKSKNRIIFKFDEVIFRKVKTIFLKYEHLFLPNRENFSYSIEEEEVILNPINQIIISLILVRITERLKKSHYDDFTIYRDNQIKELVANWCNNYCKKIDKINNTYHKILERGEVSDSKFFNRNLSSEFEAYNFQNRHARFIRKYRRTANFSSPGAGKTIISYLAALNLYENNLITDIVAIGPISAGTAWKEEWKILTTEEHVDEYKMELLDFSNKSTSSINKITTFKKKDGKLRIWFINFHKFQNETFTKKLISKLKDKKIMTIIDEAHYLKNYNAKRHINIQYLSFCSDFSLLLTGTPIPRKLKETYFIINLLFPFIDHKNLSKKVFDQQDQNKHPSQEFIERFGTIFLKQDKNTLVRQKVLKPIHTTDIKIAINPVEEKLIKLILENKLLKKELEKRDIEKMSKAFIIRRMQASSFPEMLLKPLDEVTKELKEDMMDSEDMDNNLFKLEERINKALDLIIEGNEFRSFLTNYLKNNNLNSRWETAMNLINKNKENIIVWDVFRLSMSEFQNYLQKNTKRKVYLINGSVQKSDRVKILDEFKNSIDAILIASPATIAESVSLHRECHKAIYLYRNFVGSHYMQSRDRIHRLVRPHEESFEKNIYNIISNKPSIDQNININLESKIKNQSKLID